MVTLTGDNTSSLMMDDFSSLFLRFRRLLLFLVGVLNAHDKSVVCAVASAIDESGSLVNGDGGVGVGDDDDVMLTLSDNNIRRIRECGKLLLLQLVMLIMAGVVEANWVGGMDAIDTRPTRRSLSREMAYL